METAVQRDYSNGESPACPTEAGYITSNGGAVVSDVAPAAVPTSPVSLLQQDYCNGEMELPNATVCCDMSTGQWVPAAVIRDTMATVSVSAACPTSESGNAGGSSGSINF